MEIDTHVARLDNPALRDERFSKAQAWCWLIEKAVWQPTKFDAHGKTVVAQRGQFFTTTRALADAWGWGETSVRRFLARLKSSAMVLRTREFQSNATQNSVVN